MRKIKKKEAILVVLVALIFNIFMLGIHGVSLAAGTEKQYMSEGFSLTLPENWGEVPYNVLKEYEKTLNETIAKGGSEQFYAHAFQLKSAKKTFEYPYVLIQIKKDGKIPQSKVFLHAKPARRWLTDQEADATVIGKEDPPRRRSVRDSQGKRS